MKRLKSSEIKQKELEILIEFDAFCRKNHLTYSLCGGTLLGAIRHKGFIPWDDDIDVCMPRPDYEKLIRNFSSQNRNIEIRSILVRGFDAPFSKIVNKKCIVSQKHSSRIIDDYIWVDIFPIDGLPDDETETRKIYRVCNFYRKMYFLCEAKLGEGRTPLRKIAKYFLKPIANIYGKRRCCEKLESISKRYPYETANYVGSIAWGLYGFKERVSKKIFELPPSDVTFEGHSFKAFGDWNEYLTRLYGSNYMELPPLSMRVSHDLVVYEIEGE